MSKQHEQAQHREQWQANDEEARQYWRWYQSPEGQTWRDAMAQQGQHMTNELAPKPRKKRRVFLWVFLAVQVIFIAWLIGGAASMHGVPAQCHGYTGQTLQNCKDASNVGGGIAMAMIFGLWVGADIILCAVYGVYRLFKR